jgi:hypothetical protein
MVTNGNCVDRKLLGLIALFFFERFGVVSLREGFLFDWENEGGGCKTHQSGLQLRA